MASSCADGLRIIGGAGEPPRHRCRAPHYGDVASMAPPSREQGVPPARRRPPRRAVCRRDAPANVVCVRLEGLRKRPLDLFRHLTDVMGSARGRGRSSGERAPQTTTTALSSLVSVAPPATTTTRARASAIRTWPGGGGCPRGHGVWWQRSDIATVGLLETFSSMRRSRSSSSASSQCISRFVASTSRCATTVSRLSSSRRHSGHTAGRKGCTRSSSGSVDRYSHPYIYAEQRDDRRTPHLARRSCSSQSTRGAVASRAANAIAAAEGACPCA